jgi:hypothetical protein
MSVLRNKLDYMLQKARKDEGRAEKPRFAKQEVVCQWDLSQNGCGKS